MRAHRFIAQVSTAITAVLVSVGVQAQSGNTVVLDPTTTCANTTTWADGPSVDNVTWNFTGESAYECWAPLTGNPSQNDYDITTVGTIQLANELFTFVSKVDINQGSSADSIGDGVDASTDSSPLDWLSGGWTITDAAVQQKINDGFNFLITLKGGSGSNYGVWLFTGVDGANDYTGTWAMPPWTDGADPQALSNLAVFIGGQSVPPPPPSLRVPLPSSLLLLLGGLAVGASRRGAARARRS